MGSVTASDRYPSTDRRLSSLHVGVRTHGSRITAAGLFRGTLLQQDLPLAAYGAAGDTPNRSWDEALTRLGWSRLGQWLHHASAQLWIAEVSGQPTPAEGGLVVPTRPDLRYIVLTTELPDSGLVFGAMPAVSAAARARLSAGHGAVGALVAAYIRMSDALVPVAVETTQVAATDSGSGRYRIRTWWEHQLLGQAEFEV